MFTENDIRQEMQRLDVQSGIDTSKIPIRISTRMTSTWGKCVYNLSKGKVEELVFGDRLLRYATYAHLIEVVRHEYAHAFVFIKYGKRDAHGSRWRYWAQNLVALVAAATVSKRLRMHRRIWRHGIKWSVLRAGWLICISVKPILSKH